MMKSTTIQNTADDWQPQIFDLANPEDSQRIKRLQSQGAVWQTQDQIQAQLNDLARTRNPQWQRQPADPTVSATAVEAILQGKSPNSYGRWVYYPWSGQLVHLLNQPEFEELRLNRNRNKLTTQDQATLAQKTIGIVGLSVGNAVAIALALEGIGGHLRLADHDHLDLSNMNRIRACTSNLGIAKTKLCARQIYEMNPYADISLADDGVTDSNIRRFFDSPQPLDVVVDECDDIRIKVKLREFARDYGIPVLMETSDRGMLDVERFDLEPERPIFHGLIPGVTASQIPVKLNLDDQLRYVAPIVGIESLSTRSAASMLEIGETLSTWPQLGSEVLLGSASIATALKQLFLSTRLVSGRQHIDLNELIEDRQDSLLSAPPSEPATLAVNNFLQAPATTVSEVSELLKFLVEAAVLAPSGGNAQPWRFYIQGEALWVTHDQARSDNLIDAEKRGAHVALGAALENILLAASSRGYSANVEYFPTPDFLLPEHHQAIARIHPGVKRCAREQTQTVDHRLFQQMAMRKTDRKIYGHLPLDQDITQPLVQIVEQAGGSLRLLNDATSLAEVGTLVGEADRLRMLFDDTHREMMDEIRWSPHATQATRDGIDIATLDLSLSELTALQIVKRQDVAKFVRHHGGADVLTQLSHNAVMNSSAVGLLSVSGNSKQAHLQGGRAMQRLWLLATSLGLALHPITALIYMFNADLSPRLDTQERSKLCELCDRFDLLFPNEPQDSQLLLFRLSKGQAQCTRSLRRPLSEVLSIVPNTTTPFAKEL